jgi:HD-GYP domain-containing protein (c-di-GMP phosphodiesterase class II)
VPESLKEPHKHETPNFAPRFYGIVLLVAAIFITGLWLVQRYTAIDLARDMQTWQEKLSLIAESRAADVNDFVSGHFKELRTLADNPSLQLYLTELQSAPEPKGSAAAQEPAQKSYLRNLLVFTADRTGFSTPAGEQIQANVNQESKNALAVINNENQIVVSTSMTPATRDIILERAKNQSRGQESLIDVQKDSEGTPYIGFIVPIFSIQGEHNPEAQIGKVVGIKIVDQNLFGLLKHPGVTEQTLEATLARTTEDKKIEFISPLLDGTAPISKQIDRDVSKSAETLLLRTPGDFVSDKRDYRNKPVLGISRAIAGTPWSLVVKIDRQEALAESDARRGSMIVFFILMIAIVILIIFAVWWHAHSKRAMMMSAYFRKLAAQAQAQEQLLRLVADHQPEPIYIVDANQNFQFANQKAADDADMTASFVAGKKLPDIRGTVRAEQIWEQCRKSLDHNQIVFDIATVHSTFGERVIRSAYAPLDHIPIATLPEHTPGVLVVEQDITEVVHEREQRLKSQDELIHTLVGLVDKRDPFAADHSLLVSKLAAETASQMELDNISIDTARIAGSLMNIGKILVPTELLTKTDSLSADEKRTVRESMLAAADLVKNISFDGPVAETLKQWQEKWDGSGPSGAKAEEILVTARIIAAANAFIGMISPRSWRTAMPIEAANKFLLDQSDTLFDRRVVVALINYVENHSGKAWLKQVLEEKKNAA